MPYTPTSSVKKSQIIHTAADAAESARIAHQNLRPDPHRVIREFFQNNTNTPFARRRFPSINICKQQLHGSGCTVDPPTTPPIQGPGIMPAKAFWTPYAFALLCVEIAFFEYICNKN